MTSKKIRNFVAAVSKSFNPDNAEFCIDCGCVRRFDAICTYCGKKHLSCHGNDGQPFECVDCEGERLSDKQQEDKMWEDFRMEA